MLNLSKSFIIFLMLIIASAIISIANLFINSPEGWATVGIMILFALIMIFHSYRLFKRTEKSWED